MKALIVYDSMYGNTERIAQAIGGAIADDVKVLRVGEVDPSDLESIDLLIVGSPTQGGRATQAMQDFLSRLPEPTLRGIRVAAFDTRFTSRWVRIFGYAAGRIARVLKEMGGNLVAPPEGFFVTGTEGPLREGELERAAGWAKGIAK